MTLALENRQSITHWDITLKPVSAFIFHVVRIKHRTCGNCVQQPICESNFHFHWSQRRPSDAKHWLLGQKRSCLKKLELLMENFQFGLQVSLYHRRYITFVISSVIISSLPNWNFSWRTKTEDLINSDLHYHYHKLWNFSWIRFCHQTIPPPPPHQIWTPHGVWVRVAIH